MTYCIIGTGNTAWFMATKLFAAGHTCTGIYGRNLDKANELALTISTIGYDVSNGVIENADVCIIAVSDNAIAAIASTLCFESMVLIHTAGAVEAEILSKSAPNYGVLWPVYSITKNNLPTTRKIPSVYEASNQKVKEVIAEIASSFTDIIVEADSNKRKWLHLTAVFSNNFTNHLFSIAEKICTEQNMPFSLLLPIIQQTVDRLTDASPLLQQTGPAKRGDIDTLNKHEALLKNNMEWQKVYDAISKSIYTMYNTGINKD